MKVNNKSVRCAHEIDLPALSAIVIHVPALFYWFELLIFLLPNIYVWQPFIVRISILTHCNYVAFVVGHSDIIVTAPLTHCNYVAFVVGHSDHRHCASDPLQFCCFRCRRFGYHRHTHCITDSLQFCCFIISTVAGNGRCVASSTTARSVGTAAATSVVIVQPSGIWGNTAGQLTVHCGPSQ